jgi:AcrR family transcriptional regulator
MSRPAESTRGSIIKAAIHLFAEKGFEGASAIGGLLHASAAA